MSQEMGNTPVVSVILPAYNVAEYIEASIGSIRNQTLRDIEIIIVDDGSSDGTRSAIEKLAQQDGRVKAIFHEQNQGVSAARNTALNVANGEWIALVDPDDWIDEDRLEYLVDTANMIGADAIGDNQALVDPGNQDQVFGYLVDDEKQGVWDLSPAEFISHDLPEKIGYGALKFVVRRSFIEENNLRYRTDVARGEDCLFYCDCYAHGMKAFLTSEAKYFYRVNREGSATNITAGLPSILSVADVHQQAKLIFKDVSDKALHDALSHRGKLIDECIQYRSIVTPLKNKQFVTAMAAALSKPFYLPAVTRRFLSAVRARHQSPV